MQKQTKPLVFIFSYRLWKFYTIKVVGTNGSDETGPEARTAPNNCWLFMLEFVEFVSKRSVTLNVSNFDLWYTLFFYIIATLLTMVHC